MGIIRYADVIVDLPIENDTLTYLVPDSMLFVAKGCRVEVEVKGRKLTGIVREVHFQEPYFNPKPILRLIDKEPILNEEQWRIASWMQETYVAGLGESVFRMIPQGRRLIHAEEPILDLDTEFKVLNPEQKKAYQEISGSLGKGHSVHLLYGITGSGKTEVYIHLIRDVIQSSDRSVIFMVPEISLTYHTIRKLEKIFPKDLALLHSALKTSERFRAYMALLRGEKRIAVGTRSAVFAPVKNLGLVILDEEHDPSYKENSSPRYHTRQVAYFRCKDSGGTLVLGSATPSIETFYLARTNQIQLHTLRKRAVENAKLPQVKIIPKNEKEGVIGFELLQEIKKQRKNKEQTIILLNRRGYNPLLFSIDKKEFIGCPNCSTNLCYHKNGIAQCHICGYKEPLEKLTSKYGKIEFLGSGTQKLEEFLLTAFPDSRVERLDQDSSQKTEILAAILTRLYQNELDILTGTQMIAKGLDVPNVTLVGVLNASQGLGIPDFRAGEKVFSLLTQVAGRAGRSEKQGRVLIEARDPQHPVLLRAMKQDYEGFYEEEILHRKQMDLPPFVRLLRLVIRSVVEEESASEILNIAHIVNSFSHPEIRMLGPSPCPFYKMEKYFRHHILIKSKTHKPTRELVRKIKQEWKKPKDVYLEIDFDPLDLV